MPKSKWIMLLLSCLILAGGICFGLYAENRTGPVILRQGLSVETRESAGAAGRAEPGAETPGTSEAEQLPEENATNIGKTEGGEQDTGERYGQLEQQEQGEQSADPDPEAWIFATEPLMVNINSADEAELEKLPGIGPGKARAIILYRQEHGPFGAIEELMQVPGIKEATFAKLKDYVTP